MAEKTTIARPYAKAAFALAREQGKLDAWLNALSLAATVVTHARVAPLLTNPRATPADLADLVNEIATGELDARAKDFIKVLATNRRLGYLPEIAAIFAHLKSGSEKSVDVMVSSAVELSAEQQKKIAAAVEKRLARTVRLHTKLDPSLIGGAVLRADDLVIDGSLKGRLDRLENELTG
ncbi:MAG: F0F1 ATP synthase subunit delta [Steroidobacterales bacterium]